MKGFLEEYGTLILAALIISLLIAFLYLGLKENGFLQILAKRFSAMTFGG